MASRPTPLPDVGKGRGGGSGGVARARRDAEGVDERAEASVLHTLKLLNELGLDEEEDELELSMMEELATLVKNADGPAGDKVKYEHAVTRPGGAGTHTRHTRDTHSVWSVTAFVRARVSRNSLGTVVRVG